jgi:nitrogen regulatory protein PII
VEILANEGRVDAIVDALARAAHTGVPGDGVVVTYPIGRYVKIEQAGRGEKPLGPQ